MNGRELRVDRLRGWRDWLQLLSRGNHGQHGLVVCLRLNEHRLLQNGWSRLHRNLLILLLVGTGLIHENLLIFAVLQLLLWLINENLTRWRLLLNILATVVIDYQLLNVSYLVLVLNLQILFIRCIDLVTCRCICHLILWNNVFLGRISDNFLLVIFLENASLSI